MATTYPAKTYSSLFLDASQNPIYDHANATKTTLTSSTVVLTPPVGCQFARISSDVDCFVRTDGLDAADAAGSLLLKANVPETIPVTPGVPVEAFATSTATVRVTPLKVR